MELRGVSGWHICTACQKDSFYMCYTCPYSVCKRCVRSSQYVLVRENKGFCGICINTILLIENAPEATKEKVQVDFDDQGSWEYLFKIYWVSLKEKLSLTLDDLIKAKNPWKSSASKRRTTTTRLREKDDGSFPGVMKAASRAKVRKMEATSFQVDERYLNTSEQHQEGESQQLNEQLSVQVRPSSSHDIVKSEALSNKAMDEDLDMSMIWLYGDPDGKIHGPFSLLNLRQWNASGYFPPELRIWRLGEQQSSSILLTDALNGQLSLPNPSISEKQEETVTIANEQNRSVVVTKLESGVLDFSSNSVCTDQSFITSSNSVITKSSDACNRGGTAWDSNSSFTDNQEIDFLDLFSSTFKFNFASNDTTTDCWQPIVTGPDECDESVSDLLAEVEAMESQKRLSSPTSTFRGFSPVEGHSPSLDASKGDSMSSTNAFKN
ncbi:PHD finger family protein [Hirschfeldia incana]|nr:PHD finger family protein [Hirschfeldia incana]